MSELTARDLAALIRAAGESGDLPAAPTTLRPQPSQRPWLMKAAVVAATLVAILTVAIAHFVGTRSDKPETTTGPHLGPTPATSNSTVGSTRPGCPAADPTLGSTSATRLPGRGPEHSPRLLVTHGTTVRIGVRTPIDPTAYYVHLEIVVAQPGSGPSTPLEYAGDPFPHQGFSDPVQGAQVTMQFRAPRPGHYPVLVATSFATSADCTSTQPPTDKPIGGSGEQVAELIVR